MLLYNFRFILLFLGYITISCSSNNELPFIAKETLTHAIIVSDDIVVIKMNSYGFLQGEFNYSFINPTTSTVYVPVCGTPFPPVLEKKIDRDWQFAYGPAMPFCRGKPLSIAANQTIELKYEIKAGPPGSKISPQFKFLPIDGEYRLVWEIFGERNSNDVLTDLLPIDLRRSNSFEIRLVNE